MRQSLAVRFLLWSSLLVAGRCGPVSLQTGEELQEDFMEMSAALADDLSWVAISSSVAFQSPSVFLSLPTTDDQFSAAMVLRMRNKEVDEDGIVSFQMKIYQPNDTDCSKEWHTPVHLPRPLMISWIIAEDGAYNFTNDFLFIGQGDIAHPSPVPGSDDNFVDIYYPTGCEDTLGDDMCRFPINETLGVIAQLQTLVNDRFLLARGLRVGVGYAKFTLNSHESTDIYYKELDNEETLSYMAFMSSLALSCEGGVLLESIVLKQVTSVPVQLKYQYSYDFIPSVFAIISSYNGQNPVGMSSFDGSESSSYFVVQEDQCADEEVVHPYGEDITTLIIGEIRYHIPKSSSSCHISYRSPYSFSPTLFPTVRPTPQPTHPGDTNRPSVTPTAGPTSVPTVIPTVTPSSLPTSSPTSTPTAVPISSPTATPTSAPTPQPTHPGDTNRPSATPTAGPTSVPTVIPTVTPSSLPTSSPTSTPTAVPISSPTATPTSAPTPQPTHPGDTNRPSATPTAGPTSVPTVIPTVTPSSLPTSSPTSTPTAVPISSPTATPTSAPTPQPTHPGDTNRPSATPTAGPTSVPTVIPTVTPSSLPTSSPTSTPTVVPISSPTQTPTSAPTPQPTHPGDTNRPSATPTAGPTSVPTVIPTVTPSSLPTSSPTSTPTVVPTSSPTAAPTSAPTPQPTHPGDTNRPSATPTAGPTSVPTVIPTVTPSSLPTSSPTSTPTVVPTSSPSVLPSYIPTCPPSIVPTSCPSSSPSFVPTVSPTAIPSFAPTFEPTPFPTQEGDTNKPSSVPTTAPTSAPTSFPTRSPTSVPSPSPSVAPSAAPTSSPTSLPSLPPTPAPTHPGDTNAPSRTPTFHPSPQPTSPPSPLPTFTFAPSAVTENLNDIEGTVAASFSLIYVLPIIFGLCCICWVALSIFGVTKSVYGFFGKIRKSRVLGVEDDTYLEGSQSGLLSCMTGLRSDGFFSADSSVDGDDDYDGGGFGASYAPWTGGNDECISELSLDSIELNFMNSARDV